jgi:AhpD family alkylhydroperoxidase
VSDTGTALTKVLLWWPRSRYTVVRMSHYHDVISELREPTRDLRRAIPDVWAGFGQMHKATFADGVLSTKIKELMAFAIATHDQCDGCIAYHARAAAAAGATFEEAAEAVGVALLMSGGPGTMYGPRAYAAFKEFAETSDEG